MNNSALFRSLKITEKVSFNIVSEASYVYILSGQKLIKNAQNVPFWKPEACRQTELPDMSVLIWQTLVENAKIEKFKCDIWNNFQTMYRRWNHHSFLGFAGVEITTIFLGLVGVEITKKRADIHHLWCLALVMTLEHLLLTIVPWAACLFNEWWLC